MSSDAWHSQRPSSELVWTEGPSAAHWEADDGVGVWGTRWLHAQNGAFVSLAVCREGFINPPPRWAEEESLAGCTPAACGAQCQVVRVLCGARGTHHLLVLPAWGKLLLCWHKPPPSNEAWNQRPAYLVEMKSVTDTYLSPPESLVLLHAAASVVLRVTTHMLPMSCLPQQKGWSQAGCLQLSCSDDLHLTKILISFSVVPCICVRLEWSHHMRFRGWGKGEA